jgi:hypothetical protein
MACVVRLTDSGASMAGDGHPGSVHIGRVPVYAVHMQSISRGSSMWAPPAAIDVGLPVTVMPMWGFLDRPASSCSCAPQLYIPVALLRSAEGQFVQPMIDDVYDL